MLCCCLILSVIFFISLSVYHRFCTYAIEITVKICKTSHLMIHNGKPGKMTEYICNTLVFLLLQYQFSAAVISFQMSKKYILKIKKNIVFIIMNYVNVVIQTFKKHYVNHYVCLFIKGLSSLLTSQFIKKLKI